MDPSSPTLISFCTGYAGLEIGIERALGRPCRVLAYAEIEAFAIENLAAKVQAGHLPPAPIWSDLRSFPGKAFHGLVDIFCGGYPCTPFSSAGKRAGKADPRHLWPFFRAQIHAIHPRVVFFENVEGHVSLGLATVLSDLEEDGYQATWGLFSAAEVGAPHRRKRVFILGYAKGDDERGFPFPPVYRERVAAGGPSGGSVGDPESSQRGSVGGACHGLAGGNGLSQREEGTDPAGESGAELAERHGDGRLGDGAGAPPEPGRHEPQDGVPGPDGAVADPHSAEAPRHRNHCGTVLPFAEPEGSGMGGVYVADPGGEGLPNPVCGGGADQEGRETPAGPATGRGAVRGSLLPEGCIWVASTPGPAWPSRPGEPQWGWEPPRT
ncbi:MAG: DNA cytosine methyltransferase, partial [Bacilli bacterium]